MNDPTPHLERFDSYERACREFRFHVPEHLNIADAICRRHEDAVTRVALTEVKAAANNTYTFGGINYLSDKFATVLEQSGISAGDAVAVILPQSAAAVVAQFGALKAGAAVVPLSIDLESASCERALKDGNAKAIVIAHSLFEKLESVIASLPALRAVFLDADGLQISVNGYRDFWHEVAGAPSAFTAIKTQSRAPAFIFYDATSPNNLSGIVHSHASLIGQLATHEMSSDFDYRDDTVFWMASDWTSADALLGMIYPAWWYGCSVVASDSRSFEGIEALRLMNRCEVTNAFISSARLEAVIEASSSEQVELRLRAVTSNVESLAPEMANRAAGALGAALNAIYSKPEASLAVTSCRRWFAARYGSAGKPAPGRLIEIIDEQGHPLPAGSTGRVAIHASDPGLFIEYLNRPDETAARFIGDWFITGERGYKDEDGYLWLSPSSL